MTLSTRRVVLATAVAFSTLFSAGVAAAEAIKVAAIYTLPVEQQWISRIHKALNAAQDRGEIEYLYSENVANNDYERVMREYAEQGSAIDRRRSVRLWNGRRARLPKTIKKLRF